MAQATASSVAATDGAASLSGRPVAELEAMHEAAEQVILAGRALAQSGASVVSALMPGAQKVETWAHYPSRDVLDRQTGVQFYYHAHPEDERGEGEHGHFHVFVYPDGAPPVSAGTTGMDAGGSRDGEAGGGHAPAGRGNGPRPTHLIAISVDALSQPIGLFTTNRWVTGETWLQANEVIPLVRGFTLTPTAPFAETRQWLAGMMTLFRPHIEALIAERDARIAAWRETHAARVDVFEDRRLNRVSTASIDLADQVMATEQALGIAEIA